MIQIFIRLCVIRKFHVHLKQFEFVNPYFFEIENNKNNFFAKIVLFLQTLQRFCKNRPCTGFQGVLLLSVKIK